MKKLLLLLLVPVLSLAQENQKVPNFFPSHTTNQSIPENLDMPTTQWSDLADVSWYNESDLNLEISTAEEFAGLAQLVIGGNSFADKTISLTSNLDLGDHLWTPIGTGVDTPFSGTFDGNNYTISNLNINLPEDSFVGMFGHVVSGSIRNINLETAEVYGLDAVGSIVANVFSSSAYNLHANNVTVVGTDFNIGGLSGAILTGSTMENCSATNVNVSGESQIGGLLGSIWDRSHLKNSYSTGEANGNYLIGGLVGFTTVAFTPEINSVSYCYSRVNVTGNLGRTGGLYGGAQGALLIENSYSTGTATSAEFEGGFVGSAANIQIINSYFDFETSEHIEGIGGWEGPALEVGLEARSSESMKTEAFVAELNQNAEEGAIWFMGDESNDFYPMLTETLSVDNVVVNKALVQLYPNPVVNELHLKSNQDIQSIELYNANGQMLKTLKSVNKVSVSDLPKGVYFLKIRINETTQFEKFIKK